MGCRERRTEKPGNSFYTKLFKAEGKDEGSPYPGSGFPSIRLDQVAWLEREVTPEETWKALSSMSSLKASGPDGFPVLFFQKSWSYTGPALVDFVKRIVERAEINREANESFIVLIPK